MFLQVAVPNDDNRCLRFLSREYPEQRIQVYEYVGLVFGAKSLPTCANYALHQVAKGNAKDEENLFKAVLQNFYMDDFLSQSEHHKKRMKSTRKLERSLAKVDSI